MLATSEQTTSASRQSRNMRVSCPVVQVDSLLQNRASWFNTGRDVTTKAKQDFKKKQGYVADEVVNLKPYLTRRGAKDAEPNWIKR